MRGVAGDEHAADPELVGQHAFERPARELVDRQRDLFEAERESHVGLDSLIAEAAQLVAVIGEVEDPLLAVGAPASRSHRHEHRHAADRRAPDPADQHVRIARDVRQVRADVHRPRLRDHAEPVVLDADLLRDRAAAVAAEEVLRAHRVLAAVVEIADARRHAVGILREFNQLVVEAHAARIHRFCPPLEDRLQADLRKVGRAARARRHPVEIGVAVAPALDLPDASPELGVGSGEPRVPAHRAHVLGRRALRIDLLRDTDVGQDLHRLLVQHVRLRKDRRRRQRAHEQMLDAELRQQHRSGEAGAAAADDQNGHFEVLRAGRRGMALCLRDHRRLRGWTEATICSPVVVRAIRQGG